MVRFQDRFQQQTCFFWALEKSISFGVLEYPGYILGSMAANSRVPSSGRLVPQSKANSSGPRPFVVSATKAVAPSLQRTRHSHSRQASPPKNFQMKEKLKGEN